MGPGFFWPKTGLETADSRLGLLLSPCPGSSQESGSCSPQACPTTTSTTPVNRKKKNLLTPPIHYLSPPHTHRQMDEGFMLFLLQLLSLSEGGCGFPLWFLPFFQANHFFSTFCFLRAHLGHPQQKFPLKIIQNNH